MKVIVAVPNYNMRETLGVLLGSLRGQGFAGVYVLDDASTDGSANFVKVEFPEVIVVRGGENMGAGGNRNRILPFLEGDELVLFVDADILFESVGIRKAVMGWFAQAEIGLTGGLIHAKEGRPMHWNYGFTMNPVNDARTEVYEEIAKVTTPSARAFKRIRQMAVEQADTYNFEIQYAKPVRRQVDWVAEGLFAVRAEVFKSVGGYDERFRYHGDQDLGVRIGKAGYGVWFDPAVRGRHLEIDVRGEARRGEFREGQYLFYEKYWGMSRKVFDRLYPKVY